MHVETSLYFQNISRTTKNFYNCGRIFLTYTRNYLSTKYQVHSVMSSPLRARQLLIFSSQKRAGFFAMINNFVKIM